MANDINYTPVADGFHNCRIVFAKRAEKHFGKEVNAHVVYEMRLVPTDCPDIENPASYKTDFPVVIVPGFDWDFYDEAAKRNVWRKATAEDTKQAVDYAQKCFPAWKEFCDGLPDGSDEAAFAWFANPEMTKDVVVRAKLMRLNPYTGTDGMEHENLRARIYAPFEIKPMLADGESKQIANALKAAGIKLFGKPKGAKPATPAAPKAKSVKELTDEAYAKYQEFFSTDKTGAGFYPKCAEIIGKEMNTWESWTVSDWQKIIEDMTDIPF